MKLINDSVFIEKRNSVIKHMQEGNHMFYSSMQELLRYLSIHCLRAFNIYDNNLRERRNKILKEGSNAISAIKFVCTVIQQQILFDTLNMSLFNILANNSKHSTIVFPYHEGYAEDIVNTYNTYIRELNRSILYSKENIITEDCYIDFKTPSPKTNTEENVSNNNQPPKVEIETPSIPQYLYRNGAANITITMGGNKWLVSILYARLSRNTPNLSSYSRAALEGWLLDISITLIKKNTEYVYIDFVYDNNIIYIAGKPHYERFENELETKSYTLCGNTSGTNTKNNPYFIIKAVNNKKERIASDDDNYVKLWWENSCKYDDIANYYVETYNCQEYPLDKNEERGLVKRVAKILFKKIFKK